MNEDKTITENKLDRLKLLSITDSIHSLKPPMRNDENPLSSVAIIKALESDEKIKQTLVELKGYILDPFTNEYKQVRKPIMNDLGLGNLFNILRGIAKEYEFSNLHEDEIPPRYLDFFKDNYPTFTIYYKEFEIEPYDFNVIRTILKSNIDGILHKCKGGGHRNVVRGTYSEDVLSKALKEDERKKKEGATGGLARLNPFRKQ